MKYKTYLCPIFGLAAALVVALAATGCASHPAHGPIFNGTVRSVDLQNHLLTLAPLNQSASVVFLWETNTKFWKNGIPIKPAEVESGQSVRIHYHIGSCRAVAHHVYLQAPYAPAH